MAVNYSPKIITDGLIVYMDAANINSYPGSGTAWTDLGMSQSNNSVLTGGATFSSDNMGSIAFNGTSSYAISATYSSLVGNTAITYSFWVKSTPNADYQTLISNGVQPGGSGFVWIFRSPSSNFITMQYANGSIPVNSSAGGMFNNFNNLWINICCVVDYSNALITWYKNGVLYSGPTALTTPLVPINRLYYMGSYNASLHFLNGNISTVKFYNRILTDTEVLQNYNTLKGRFGL